MDSPSSAYPTVSPYLIVADASTVMDFTRTCFDATVVNQQMRADGTVKAAALRIGDSIVMLTERADSTPSTRLHVYVANVETSHQRALTHGATSLSAPETVAPNTQRAGVTDPCGVQWWMSTAPDGTEAV
jgi:PhnB protein